MMANWFSTVIWISDTNRKGFRLTYPAISVHAIASSSEEFPDPCLFLVIDVKKTGNRIFLIVFNK